MNNISATAHLVAMYRALKSERPDALFQDLFARRLAGGEGALMVEVLGDKQQGTTAIAIRTCASDEMIARLVASGSVDTGFLSNTSRMERQLSCLLLMKEQIFFDPTVGK